ncbi:MAG: 4Fe-4S dicluster domain-containing protein [Chloroflexi bacterium]|nr:4Fe-4S dicluster domain-containing protein [Chloroflexota bacterium]
MKFWRKPLDLDKISLPRGEIHVNAERCKGCSFCVEYCPKNVLELSKSFNSKGYYLPLAKNEADCATCRLCELLCPEFAIHVVVSDVDKVASGV